jgi:hypothetical protein
MSKFKDYMTTSGSLDASLGLIFRLNALWQRTDAPATSGEFDKWNFILDRIFCNLLYKEDLVSEKDEEGNLTNVTLGEEDKKIYKILNRKVVMAKKLLKQAKTLDEKHDARSKLYHALMLKDIGLRKFMHKLKLYMRESDSNPSRAMWGS